MNTKINLPDNLPSHGFELEIQLRRIPEYSCAIKALLNGVERQEGDSDPVYIYGRGTGSDAIEKTHVVVRVDALTVNALGKTHDNTAWIAIEDLNGQALDSELVDIESVKLRALPPG